MSDSEKLYAGLHESFQEGVLATFNLFWVYASPLFYLSLLSLFFNYITFFFFFFSWCEGQVYAMSISSNLWNGNTKHKMRKEGYKLMQDKHQASILVPSVFLVPTQDV